MTGLALKIAYRYRRQDLLREIGWNRWILRRDGVNYAAARQLKAHRQALAALRRQFAQQRAAGLTT